MKKIIIILTSLSLLLFFSPELQAQKNKAIDKITLEVDGLGCPFCAYGLEKKMKDLKGMKKMTVDMETGLVQFNFPADGNLSLAQINAKVEEAGYTARNISITRADGEVVSENFEIIFEEVDVSGYAEASFYVNGKCKMCTARIERSARIMDGVGFAKYNLKKNTLTVKYDEELINPDNISEKMALVGHDTDTYRASDEKYKSLPPCCLYKRKKS